MQYSPERATVQSKGDGIELTYDALVGRVGREFIFLDRVFDTGNDLYGAVGTTIVPVSTEEFERREEEYRDEEWSPMYHVYEEQKENGNTKDWDTWIDDMLRHDKYELLVDPSYTHKYGDTVEERAVEEGIIESGELEVTECIGGGRMFNTIDRDFDVLYNPELLALARDVENNGLELE